MSDFDLSKYGVSQAPSLESLDLEDFDLRAPRIQKPASSMKVEAKVDDSPQVITEPVQDAQLQPEVLETIESTEPESLEKVVDKKSVDQVDEPTPVKRTKAGDIFDARGQVMHLSGDTIQPRIPAELVGALVEAVKVGQGRVVSNAHAVTAFIVAALNLRIPSQDPGFDETVAFYTSRMPENAAVLASLDEVIGSLAALSSSVSVSAKESSAAANFARKGYLVSALNMSEARGITRFVNSAGDVSFTNGEFTNFEQQVSSADQHYQRSTKRSM